MIFAVGDLARDEPSQPLTLDGITITGWQLRFRHDQASAEATAVDLLRCLIRQAHRPLTWQQILCAVRNAGFAGNTTVADPDVTHPRTPMKPSRTTTIRTSRDGRHLIEPPDQA